MSERTTAPVIKCPVCGFVFPQAALWTDPKCPHGSTLPPSPAPIQRSPILRRISHALRGCDPWYHIAKDRWEERDAHGVWWRCSVCGHEEFG
jgi:rubredoxin